MDEYDSDEEVKGYCYVDPDELFESEPETPGGDRAKVEQ